MNKTLMLKQLKEKMIATLLNLHSGFITLSNRDIDKYLYEHNLVEEDTITNFVSDIINDVMNSNENDWLEYDLINMLNSNNIVEALILKKINQDTIVSNITMTICNK